MSRVADFDRSTGGMQELFEELTDLCDRFFDIATISDSARISDLFKLYDMVLTQRATLSAMICSAKAIGTHGSALVDRLPDTSDGKARQSRTLTKGGSSVISQISPLPNPELWFEKLLARQKKG